MNKSDLKNGMVLELRNGERYMVVGEYWIRQNAWIDPDDYNEDLAIKGDTKADRQFDVVRVYRPHQYDAIAVMEKKKDTSKLVWERKEPMKMTVKEIEKALGYPVEIVADSEELPF